MEERNVDGLSKYKRSSRLPILRVDMRNPLCEVLGQLYTYLSSLMTIYAITWTQVVTYVVVIFSM